MNCQLLHDFVFQIPGQDHDIVRLGLADPVRMVNRDVSARAEIAPACKGCGRPCIRSGPCRCRSSATASRSFPVRHSLPPTFLPAAAVQQKLHQRQLGLLHLLRETLIAFQRSQPGLSSVGDQFRNARLRPYASGLSARQAYTRSDPPCVDSSSTSKTLSP